MANTLSCVLRVVGGDGERPARFLGTGVLIAPDRVLTCRHVVHERDPLGRLTEMPVTDLRVQNEEGRQVRAKAPISDPAWDLAVLELKEALNVAPPPLLWGITRALEERLRQAPLLVAGYAQVEPQGPLWQHPVGKLFRLASYRQDSQLLTQLQLAGGLPAGCSGAPALLPLGTHWAYAGTLYLGGERAAASRLIMADPVAEFLATAGLLGLARIDATRALGLSSPDTRTLELLIERPAQPLQLPNPYRGLTAFRELDAPYFHGREGATEALYRALQDHPLVTLIGASGSGKSSLLFAGLVPRLRAAGNWQIAAFRPKGDPFGELASALAPLLYPGQDKLERRKRRNQLARDLTAGALNPSDVLAVLREERPESRLLLVADQLEELYTQNLSRDRQRQLLGTLAELVQSQDTVPACTLLLSLRADFLGRLLADANMAELFKRHPKEFLGPMGEDDLRAAIAGPASQLGVSLEAGLVERILEDLGAEPGNLPLLEFALTALWERQHNASLTHEAYTAMGGVNQALARHADAVLARYPDPEPLRRIFVQLVRPGEGTEDTRQIATKAQVGEANWALVKELADARLVVTGREEDGEQETLELVHEALIRHWQPLREWMDQDRAFRSWQNRLRQAIEEWEHNGRDEGALLRGARLAEAEERMAAHRESLAAAERDYIAAGITEREREVRTRRQRTRLTIAGLAAGLLITIGLSLWAYLERRSALEAQTSAQEQAQIAQQQQRIAETRRVEAETEQTRAERQRKLAEAAQARADAQRRLAFARQLAAQSTLALTRPPTDPVKGTLLAIESLQHAHTLEGYDAWAVAMRLLARDLIRLEHRDPVDHLAFTPDGSRLATAVSTGATAAGKAQLWNLTTGDKRTTIEHAGWVVDAAFSPDGRLLATGSRDHTVVIAESDTGAELQRLTRDDAVSALAFSPDGRELAIAEKDGTIGLIAPGSGAERIRLQHPSKVVQLSFSADGRRLVSADDHKAVILWDTETGDALSRVSHDGYASGLAFGPAGPRFVSWNNDAQRGALIDVETGERLARLAYFDNAFSPDGRRLVSGKNTETVVIYDAASGEETGRLTLGAKIWSIAVSDDSTLAALVLFNDQVVVLDLLLARERCRLSHSNDVNNLAFSPDGTRLATTSDDQLAQVWDVSSGDALLRLPHDSDPGLVLFSSDGRALATVGADHLVHIWNADSGEELVRLSHDGEIGRIRFSPDSKTLVSTARFGNNGDAWGEVALWNTEDWRRIASQSPAPIGIRDIAFSDDGQILTTVRGDGSVWLLDPDSGEHQAKIAVGKDNAQSATLTADNERLVLYRGHSQPVDLVDVGTGERIATLAEAGGVTGIDLDRDRKLIATGSRHDDTWRVWEVATGQELHRLGQGCCLSPSGRRYMRGHDGQIELRDLASGAIVSQITPEARNAGWMLSPDEKRLAVRSGDSKEIELWNLETETLISRLAHLVRHDPGDRVYPGQPTQHPIVSNAYSPDGSLLATSALNDGISLWRASSGELLRHIEPPKAGVFSNFVFSPNSRLIAIVNENAGSVSVHDIETGERIWSMSLDDDIGAGSPVFSPDGSRLAFGRLLPGKGGVAQVWDITKSEMLFEFAASPEFMPGPLEFSPDGLLLAVAVYDPGAGIGVWDLETGKERAKLQPNAAVERIAFTADERRLISYDASSVARLWELETGTELFRYAHTGVSNHLTVNTKAGRAATASEAVVQVWDTLEGQAITQFDFEDRIDQLALSPDGTMLATVADGASQVDVVKVDPTIPRSDAEAEKLFTLIHEDFVHSIGFSTDGALVATGSGDRRREPWHGTARLWDALNGTEKQRFDHGGVVEEAQLNDDNSLLAALVDKEYPRGKEVHLWEVPTGRKRSVLPVDVTDMAFRPGTGGVLAVANGSSTVRVFDTRPASPDLSSFQLGKGRWRTLISPTGRLLVGRLDEADEAWIWNITTGQKIASIKHEDQIYNMALSPDEAWLATDGKDNTIRLWDIQGDRMLAKWPIPERNVSLSGFFAESGRLVVRFAKSAESRYELRDTISGAVVGQPIEGFINAFVFSPDGGLIATGEGHTRHEQDREIARSHRMGFFGAKLYRSADGAELLRLPHDAEVRGVAFSPDGTLLATRVHRYSEPVRLWDVGTGTQVGETVAPPKPDYVRDFAFSPDGRNLAVQSDKEVVVWRLSDLRRIALLRHADSIASFSFSPDGLRMAVGTDKKDGLVWDWQRERVLVRVQGVKQIHFTGDSAHLVAVHDDDSVRVWQLQADDLVAGACLRLERNLTPDEWRNYLGAEEYRESCPGLPVPKR